MSSSNRLGFSAAVALALLVVITSSPAWGRPRYRAVLIQDNGVDFAYGNASPGAYPQINEHNQVIFLNAFINGKFTARYWENGSLQRLGNDTGYTWLSAHAANGPGEFAGDLVYNTDTGDVLITHTHPFTTFDQVVTELPIDPGAHAFDSACYAARASDLNDLGVAAGWVRRPITRAYQLDYPVVWSFGGITDIGPLSGHPADSQFAAAPYVVINNSGTVAGVYAVNYSGCPSCRLGYYGQPGAISEIVAFPGGKNVDIWDINNLGILAGSADGIFGGTYVPHHAMLVSGGVKQDIHGTIYPGTSQSRAFAVNDSGAAVGMFQNFRGFYYENDTTWLLDSLLVNNASFPDLYEGFDINNRGYIVALCGWPSGTPRPCLLVPVDSGVIVNTETDLPDLSPADGRCYTGNTTPLGEDECSLRAALQHTNAQAGLDTIRFNIPVGGLPHISVNSPLPEVTERVVIDATTQPNTHYVEVSPSDSLVAGDGLVISAGRTTVRGLLLNRFAGSGLKLTTGDNNRVERCFFGVQLDSVTAAGNGQHGVWIVSSDSNHIGNGFDDEASFMAYNGGAGVFVESGNANVFLRNIYHDNGGLGIDLAPLGVNLNDSLDADLGANAGVNYPYVDSVTTSAGQTTMYGTLVAAPMVPYVVEISRSDACDTCCNGEGREAVWSTLATTNLDGVAHFATLFSGVLDSGEVYTLTATDTAKSTSEFSPCWPGGKWLHLLDGRGDAIRSELFALSKVANDPPVFTETLVDSVTTDSAGRLDLGPYYFSGQLRAGDSIEISRVLGYRFRIKPGPPVAERSWTITLDNGRFDSLDFHLSFDALDRECVQVVNVMHTTVAVNVVVSVEWNADPVYLQSLQDGLRELSNYLYDVFDGQVRLDTVFLYNNAGLWGSADVRIQASNALRPNADLDGVREAYYYVRMPRRWFGSDSIQAADFSFGEWPMHPEAPSNFRTIGHELGHYLFGFGDEYFEDFSEQCVVPKKYGFMEDNYPQSEPTASEMSWSLQYQPVACQNTMQWLINQKSCWDDWEQAFQMTYLGVYAEIIGPGERTLAGADEYFYGPNDLTGLDFDAGSLVQFQVNTTPKTTFDLRVFLNRGTAVSPMAGVDVGTWHAASGRRLDQGLTASNGAIWLLSVVSGDSIFAVEGRRRSVIPAARASADDSDFVWYSTAQELLLPPGDSMSIALAEAAGYLPANTRLDLSASNAVLELEYTNAFGSVPSAQFWPDPDTGSASVLPMSDLTGSYQVTLPVSGSYSGTARVHSLDTSSSPFFFPIDITVVPVDPASPHVRVNAIGGVAYLHPDSVKSNGRIALATSRYLPLRSGLDAGAQQLGPMVSIGSYPAAVFGTAQLVLRYDDQELDGATSPFDLEVTARIHAWNSLAHEWTELGGAVDSAQNFVSATVPGPGLYAAFTTGQPVEVEEGDQGAITPETYELAQNHPNPFNPTTSISYTLPQPGRVTLHIHNILGQTVRTLVDETRAAGRHEVLWDGRNASGEEVGSGVYFYSLRAGDVVLTRKMVLMK